jgi:hypothetical protein
VRFVIVIAKFLVIAATNCRFVNTLHEYKPNSDPSVAQPVASRYADCAAPAVSISGRKVIVSVI